MSAHLHIKALVSHENCLERYQKLFTTTKTTYKKYLLRAFALDFEYSKDQKLHFFDFSFNLLSKRLNRSKPIFHQQKRLHWVPNANKNETNNMKSTCPMHTQPFLTRHKPYSTWVWMVCIGSARLFGNQRVATRWGPCRTQNPNANGFAFWWNIG